MTVKPVILVTGATGNQGSAVTKSLLEQGMFTVRALVRNKASEKANGLESLGAELAEGDFEEVTSLATALQGVHGVFSMQDFKHGDRIDKGIIQLPLRPETTLQQLSEQDYGNIVATVFADKDRF